MTGHSGAHYHAVHDGPTGVGTQGLQNQMINTVQQLTRSTRRHPRWRKGGATWLEDGIATRTNACCAMMRALPSEWPSRPGPWNLQRSVASGGGGAPGCALVLNVVAPTQRRLCIVFRMARFACRCQCGCLAGRTGRCHCRGPGSPGRSRWGLGCLQSGWRRNCWRRHR